jgi:hypothetical protein
MPSNTAKAPLPADLAFRKGDRLSLPLHIVRDIIALLKRLGTGAAYYTDLLKDGLYNKERRKG